MKNEQGLTTHVTPYAALQRSIEAEAQRLADKYADDDRQDIKTDVMNAFFAGTRFMMTRPVQPVKCIGAVHRDTLAGMDSRHADAAKLWPERKAEWSGYEYAPVYSGPSMTVPENVVHKRLAGVISKKEQGYVMGVLRDLGMVHDPRAG